MAKIITKAVTRLQKFLAAIAGDAVAPTPITNQEKLLFNIAEEMKAASASDLPDIGSSDKNKFLHTNESTGALEWAEGGSGGGGVLVVTINDNDVFDKTWQEVADADFVTVQYGNGDKMFLYRVNEPNPPLIENYQVIVIDVEADNDAITFVTDSASGYPSIVDDAEESPGLGPILDG